jgi:hypothetical protein
MQILIADELMRFLIKSRAGIQFISKRKFDILHKGDGMCFCAKIGAMKHFISCCPMSALLLTKRINNTGRIIVQAIEVTNRKNLVKSITGQYMY